MSLDVINNFEFQQSIYSQIITATTPLAIRLMFAQVLEQTNISAPIKNALVSSAIAIQLFYDSRRLSRFIIENFGEKPEESNWRWATRKIGNFTSGVMDYLTVIHIGNAGRNLLNFLPKRDLEVTWKIEGNHDHQRDYSYHVNEEQARANLQKLKSRSSDIVRFEENLLSLNPVDNGICSAMSLSCASKVAQRQCIENHSMDCIQDVIREHCEGNESLRSVQAAFNSISLNRELAQTLPKEALVGEKVAALASFHDFRVDSRSCVDIQDSLPNGIYLGRAINSANNHKGEYFGHSIVFFKLDNKSALFDPSNGGVGLDNPHIAEKLKKICQNTMWRWRLENFYFFKLSSKTDPIPLVANQVAPQAALTPTLSINHK